MSLERDLSKHRLVQAEQCLKEAKLLFDNDGLKAPRTEPTIARFIV